MTDKRVLVSSRLMKNRRLFFFRISLALFLFVPKNLYAHASPNSLLFLDVNPDYVTMEIQLPIPELELSFGNSISKDPATLVERMSTQLREYLLAHIHAYITKGRPWQVEIVKLRMDKGAYVENNIPYWELVANVVLKPLPGETTRKFMLDYDVIMHQVMNHIALVSIRSDWESGNIENDSTQATVIGWNMRDNVIPPLEVSLGEGSKWKGFRSMVNLGIEHIKTGTDHLMFLLVLLLPAPLLVRRKRWAEFGGDKYSIMRLLKIVTAFTVGHSITLLAGALGWLRLPSQPVEILIAFSILVSAIHALCPIFPGKEVYVAGGFGLVHGLAFASTLADLHLGASAMVLSILGFNIGIELMQLFVIAITVPWLIILSRTKAYEVIRIAGASFAAVAAIAWMLQRYLNEENFLTSFMESIAKNAIWMVLLLAIGAVGSFFIHRRQAAQNA